MSSKQILERIKNLNTQQELLNQQFTIRSTKGLRKYYEMRIAKWTDRLSASVFNQPLSQ